ncbi:hypothetical protein PFISCL1PPCAC_17533, partial [Pristionchus fissidentatus]
CNPYFPLFDYFSMSDVLIGSHLEERKRSVDRARAKASNIGRFAREHLRKSIDAVDSMVNRLLDNHVSSSIDVAALQQLQLKNMQQLQQREIPAGSEMDVEVEEEESEEGPVIDRTQKTRRDSYENRLRKLGLDLTRQHLAEMCIDEFNTLLVTRNLSIKDATAARKIRRGLKSQFIRTRKIREEREQRLKLRERAMRSEARDQIASLLRDTVAAPDPSVDTVASAQSEVIIIY